MEDFFRRENYDDITIHLGNIHDPFIAPTQDFFSENVSFVSGVEMIRRELTATSLWLNTRRKIRIFLPHEHFEPGLASKAKGALERYCQFKIRQNRQTMKALQKEALQALLVGFIFLFSCLYLSQFLDKLTWSPAFLHTLFVDGFDIAFWVILWRPLDFFLFELWPYWREERIYKRMMEMEVIFSEI